MSVNGITGSSASAASVTDAYSKQMVKPADGVKAESATASASDAVSKAFDGQSAVYEKSAESADKASDKSSKVANLELVNKLKMELEARTTQLQNIVNQLISKQGLTYNHANGLKGLYEALEVDAETKAQAEKDIAEDGYFGVDQTSSRIFDFAMALTGGDKEKMEKMKDAFLKGYKQAEDTWGDKLPDICQKTYDAVLKKFEDYANSEDAQ